MCSKRHHLSNKDELRFGWWREWFPSLPEQPARFGTNWSSKRQSKEPVRLCPISRVHARLTRNLFCQFLFNNTFLRAILGGNFRLWSRFVSPQNDLWWPNFSQMESKHLSSENNFPFPDSAARKDSRTNSAKIALSQWIHYLAPVFILIFHFFRVLDQIWCYIRNRLCLLVPNLGSDLLKTPKKGKI